jgi:hypothetical protein
LEGRRERWFWRLHRFLAGRPARLHRVVECSKLALPRRHWNALNQLRLSFVEITPRFLLQPIILPIRVGGGIGRCPPIPAVSPPFRGGLSCDRWSTAGRSTASAVKSSVIWPRLAHPHRSPANPEPASYGAPYWQWRHGRGSPGSAACPSLAIQWRIPRRRGGTTDQRRTLGGLAVRRTVRVDRR